MLTREPVTTTPISVSSKTRNYFTFLSFPAKFLNFLLVGVTHVIVSILYFGWGLTFDILLPMLGLGCALAVPFVANPVHSLLALIMCFVAAAVALITSGGEFLGYLFLIVYIGAIAILFLFVIMLLNVRQLTAAKTWATWRRYTGLAPIVVLLTLASLSTKMLFEIMAAVESRVILTTHLRGNLGTRDILIEAVNYQFHDILIFADLLYTDHAALFMLSTLLLLSAMIGAIVLATNSTEQS